MKRLSCILGLHWWHPQTKREIIAETRYGWIWRVRHFGKCLACDATTPSRIRITHDFNEVYPNAQSTPNRVCCDRMGCENPMRGDEARAATGILAGSRSSRKFRLAFEPPCSPKPALAGAELLRQRKE